MKSLLNLNISGIPRQHDENDLNSVKELNPISTSGRGGGVETTPLPHSNYLKKFKKYKLVWAVFLRLSIYFCLTYSQKPTGFRCSRKFGRGYFVGSI